MPKSRMRAHMLHAAVRVALGIATVSFAALPVSAQLLEDYRFKGKTLTTSGEPLPGVAIKFYNTDSGKRIDFKSNDEGKFDRRLIPRGVYDVRFEKEGYVGKSERFDWQGVSTETIVQEAQIVLESHAEQAERDAQLARAALGEKKAKLYSAAYDALGKSDCKKAKSKAEELLALGAETYEYAARFVVARCLRVLGDLDASILEYQKVIELKPDLFEAQLDLAILLSMKERFDESLKHFQAAGELHPEDATVQYEMGAMMFNQSKHAEAIPYLEKTVSLDPSHARAQMALGYAILQSGGDFAAAKVALSRFLELAPEDPNAATVQEIVSGLP